MSMNYKVRQEGGVTVLDLSGRISRGETLAFGPGTVMELHEAVRKLVQKGHKKLLFNLRHVTYIDSSGLGEVVACMTTVQNHEGEFRVCCATERVDQMLRFTRMDRVLQYVKDEAAALQAFAQRARKSAA